MLVKPHIHFIIGLLLVPMLVFSQSEKQKALEAQRLQLQNELKQVNALLFNTKKEKKSVITFLEDLNYKVSVRQNLINITNQQANLLTQEINNNQNEISALVTQLKTLKEDYSAMLVKAYKSKSKQSKIMFLLSSENFKQAYKRLQYLKQYTNYQKQQAQAIKEKTAALQALNITLSKQKKDKQKLITQNRIAKQKLEAEIKERETLMASIQHNMAKFTSQINKKKQEINRIDKEINSLIKTAIAASNKKAGKTTSTGKFVLTPEAKKLANSFAANKGKLGWPVARGVVKSKFGRQRSLIDASVYVNNSGIRIATEKNAEVKAVFDGVVSQVHIIRRGNPALLIRHGDYLSIYTNLSEILVKKGDTIKTGQVIGRVFTNKVTGQSLLGFRINKNSQALNPQYWLARQ